MNKKRIALKEQPPVPSKNSDSISDIIQELQENPPLMEFMKKAVTWDKETIIKATKLLKTIKGGE